MYFDSKKQVYSKKKTPGSSYLGTFTKHDLVGGLYIRKYNNKLMFSEMLKKNTLCKTNKYFVIFNKDTTVPNN